MTKQSVSNLEVKKINRNQIYRCINQLERVSKPEIAANLGVSMPTVLQNVNELLERGLVAEVGAYESTGGRKAKVISPVYNARFAIGVDITQNHIGMALTDLSGKVLNHTRLHKIYRNDDPYYRELSEIVLEFLRTVQISKDNFLGFGFSVPGIVTQDSQMITDSHALGFANLPCKLFTKYIPYDCSIFTNDANAAMIAEMYHHSEKQTAVYLSLSNSVGGSIYIKKNSGFDSQPGYDNLFLGENFRGGEFGHMTLYPGGTSCYCGKNGCVDSYCSAKVLAQNTDGKLENFFEAVEKNNLFSKTWDEYLDHLAIVINTLRMAFDCQVIIGGYVGSFIEPYLEILKKKTITLNTFELDASYIKPCRFRIEASALGAALRHIENFIYTI